MIICEEKKLDKVEKKAFIRNINYYLVMIVMKRNLNKPYRNFFLSLLAIVTLLGSVKGHPGSGSAIEGIIKNYSKQSLYLFRCYGDTLLLLDSTRTNEKGEFTFKKNIFVSTGIYKVMLSRNQFFYLLNNVNEPGEKKIHTIYKNDAVSNIATDSLRVINSEENKAFCQFQRLQNQLNICNYWLLQMMRLYPLHDSFHSQIEDEYFFRYKAMDQFAKSQIKKHPNAMATKVVKAYYQPLLPDWKDPDPDRDKIIMEHYFDFFNPADSFYLQSNILSEKINLWFTGHSDKKESQQWNEGNIKEAAVTFLSKTKSNEQNFYFTLNYILRKLNEQHYKDALLFLYDKYVKTEVGSCKPSTSSFNWIREKVSVIRNITVGNIAPDFEIEGNLHLSSFQGDHTLLLFWASWCSHCWEELPEIKKVTDAYNQKTGKQLTTVAISLDSSRTDWQNFVQKGNYTTWLNISELKGWEGKVPKLYNVFETPSLFLLDWDKRIIAKPEDAKQLMDLLR
jgi:peroxiredoxin